MSSRKFLVLGATGNQGGAVTNALLEAGHAVRALVRDASSVKAQALAARGVELAIGDFDHGDTITAAALGVDGVFVNTSPFVPGVGLDGEVRQGRTIIDALVNAKVPHVVYSSVSDANGQTGVPHFETKFDAEQYLAASGLAHTITAPVYFSDNVLMPWNLPGLQAGTFRQALPANRILQVVSVGEIGRFNAAVLARGVALAGRRINYAGDELTSAQIAERLSAAGGREIAYDAQPVEEVASYSPDMAAMFKWFDAVGYTADIDGLRTEFPEAGWMRFDEWIASQPLAAMLQGA